MEWLRYGVWSANNITKNCHLCQTDIEIGLDETHGVIQWLWWPVWSSIACELWEIVTVYLIDRSDDSHDISIDWSVMLARLIDGLIGWSLVGWCWSTWIMNKRKPMKMCLMWLTDLWHDCWLIDWTPATDSINQSINASCSVDEIGAYISKDNQSINQSIRHLGSKPAVKVSGHGKSQCLHVTVHFETASLLSITSEMIGK